MRFRASVVALSIAAACASQRPERRAAHAAFARDAYDAAWERAARAVLDQGWAIELADRDAGILVTSQRELQAPCGAESCLSRDRAFLRLTPVGQAVANIEREHWDAAARRWAASSDPESVAAVERAQVDLLRSAVGGELALRRSRLDEPCHDPGECERDLGCELHRCRPPAAR